jgi:hypothetical protein
MALFLCSRCGHKQHVDERPINGRPADEFELFQQAHDHSGWNFLLTTPRTMLCKRCTPLYIAERDNLPPDPAERLTEPMVEQGRLI